MKNLKEGDHGILVAAVQKQLRELGYNVVVDGDFGPRTKRAVLAFQDDWELEKDGIVGEQTYNALLLAQVAQNQLPTQRCLPLRKLADGRAPHVTSGHKLRNPERPTHYGCDLFYPYLPADPPMKVGDGGRTAKWWIPPNTQAVASADGRVVLASWSRTGYRVWIDHGNKVHTGYFHLDKIGTTVGAIVPMGYPLGRVSDNPIDTDAKHLHFEVYIGLLEDYPAGTRDPQDKWLVGATILPA